MEITSVECLILDGDYPFVWVHTDDGIAGIGECFRRQPEVTKTLVNLVLAPAIVGKDPLDTQVRFRDMMRAGSAVEMGGAIFCAASAMVPYSQEYNIEPITIRDEWPILKQPLEVVDGHIAAPDGPGLGVELDDDMVRRLSSR